GCPSSQTSATSTPVASSAAIRNGQSSGRGPDAAGASSVVLLICQSSRNGSGTEAELLLQVIPLGARGGKRPARVGGPVDHRAVIQLHVVAPKNLGQHEPVG